MKFRLAKFSSQSGSLPQRHKKIMIDDPDTFSRSPFHPVPFRAVYDGRIQQPHLLIGNKHPAGRIVPARQFPKFHAGAYNVGFFISGFNMMTLPV